MTPLIGQAPKCPVSETQAAVDMSSLRVCDEAAGLILLLTTKMYLNPKTKKNRY